MISISYYDLRRWKYKLAEPYKIETYFEIYESIDVPYIKLNKERGELIIMPGYAWDGPSGPTPDFKSTMRGSLIHDALYQLMRMSKLHISFRLMADNLFMHCLVADGMPKWLAKVYWWVVRTFADGRATPQIETPLHMKISP
jgi:hypothetical protein